MNRFREGNHTTEDLLKIKERLVEQNSTAYPSGAPHLFIQNAKVTDFNERVHNSATTVKYNIKAQDSVIGANSLQLRNKIMKQIPDDPRKTKQLISNLRLTEGERVEIAINVRTEDGITNGAAGIVKLIQLHHKEKPLGVVWVQFQHSSVGHKTRVENKQLYLRAIQPTWTPIKPVTVQFAVGRNQTAQVVRKQFPLRPAAAKTIHRSQGDTESTIVVNFDTKRAIPHIHYVGLSRVTTIEGLYITDLCEKKIAVSPHVKTEMERLRTQGTLELCISSLYKISQSMFKLCFLNARSLHKHIEDLRRDYNYNSSELLICAETRFSPLDTDDMYAIDGFSLFRNDSQCINTRPYGGTAVYSQVSLVPGFPYICNTNGIEITVMRVSSLPNITIIAIYRSPKISLRLLCESLNEILDSASSQYTVIIGDFNVNWMNEMERRPLYNLLVNAKNYRQLISSCTTDNGTIIDHIYTNMPTSQINSGILETYFTDHKAIWMSFPCQVSY